MQVVRDNEKPTDVHELAQWERKHKVEHYATLIEEKRALLNAIEDTLKGSSTDPLTKARLRVEAEELRNQLFYNEREHKAAIARAKQYDDYMAKMKPVVENPQVWEELGQRVDEALRIYRQNAVRSREFGEIKRQIFDQLATLGEQEKINAFNMVIQQLAGAKIPFDLKKAGVEMEVVG